MAVWGRIVADDASEGIGLLDEIGQAGSTDLAAEVPEL